MPQPRAPRGQPALVCEKGWLLWVLRLLRLRLRLLLPASPQRAMARRQRAAESELWRRCLSPRPMRHQR